MATVLHVRVVAAVLTIGMLAAAGCTRTTNRGIPHPHSENAPPSSSVPQPAAPSGSITQRWTTENLTQAFSAINDKIGANPADYLEVTIAAATVMVKAVDPKKPENVDQYEYNGAGVQVSPVDVSSNEPGVVEESKFKSDTVKPSVLSAVLNSAVKDSGVEGGTISASPRRACRSRRGWLPGSAA